MSWTANKKELRQAVLQRLRRDCVGTARQEQSFHLRRALSGILKDTPRLKVALYAALPHEVDLLPLLVEYPQHLYGFPRCYAQGRMEFFAVHSPERELERSQTGFLQPLESCAMLEAADLQLILIPGVAFTPEGARLGYGGGFYDRYLLRCPQAMQIALCFDEQLIDAIPTQPHDLKIPHLISTSATSR